MEPQEIDIALDELENRLDRLRSLYEQYFLGIEKIEPSVARKDVDRRFWILRKTQIRNTARRFRLQVITQRYNTFQQHWTRICREIENGTYVRHLLKAKKRLGEDPKTWAAKKRLGLLRKDVQNGEPTAEDGAPENGLENGAGGGDDFEDEITVKDDHLAGMLTGGDLDHQVMAATAAAFETVERSAGPPGRLADGRFSLDDLGPLNLDFVEEDEPAQITAPKAPPLPRVNRPATSGVARTAAPGKVPTLPPPVPIEAPRTPAPLERARPPLPVRAPPGSPPRSPLPPANAAPPRPPLPSTAGVEGPARPRMPSVTSEDVAPRPRMPSVTSEGAPPAPRARMPSVSGAGAPARPGVAPGARPPLPPRNAVPLPPKAAPPEAKPQEHPPAPFPPAKSSPSSAPPPRPRMPTLSGEPRPVPAAAARPPVRTGAVPLPKPTPIPPAPPPARLAPNAQAASGSRAGLTEDRLKQLHQELGETKKKLNLGSNVSLDALSKSLRDTEQKLRAQHGGKSVDFQVVVKDGKAVVKPIVRK